ncbi:mitochondrial thiamine pyrophosphate transporter [Mortierella sp. AD094]|nr:mitochondrial thiamine pyrophosphate transporter [Mortierella sp. AD094]
MSDQQSTINASHAHNDNPAIHVQGPDSTTTKNSNEGTHEKTGTKRSSIAAGAPTLSKTETVLCGASAGVVSRFVIAPLDVVKIRLQMQTQRKDLSSILKRKSGTTSIKTDGSLATLAKQQQQQPKYKGMFSGMAMIVREEGVRGLWKGNMAAEYLYLTYSGIQFLVYQQTKVLLKKTSDLSAQTALAAANTSTSQAGSIVAVPFHAVSAFTSSSAVQSWISGANAGIIATACTYPFDLLRTRFAVQQDVKVYTGIVQACRHIYRADGIPGFYRGMSPALIQVIPYMGIMFASYDTLKHLSAWLKYKANVESSYSNASSTTSNSTSSPQFEPERKQGTKNISQVLLGLEDLVCGGLSGVISKTSVYPLDMVRKRLQIQGSEQQKVTVNIYSPTAVAEPKPLTNRLPTTVWRCIVHIARTEGYLALYKGLLPGLVKAAPSSAVTFLVFSQAGTFVEKYLRPNQRQDE